MQNTQPNTSAKDFDQIENHRKSVLITGNRKKNYIKYQTKRPESKLFWDKHLDQLEFK